jgi:hypothetical protein
MAQAKSPGRILGQERGFESSAGSMTRGPGWNPPGLGDWGAFEESYNLLNAWLAVIPGNGACNLRPARASRDERPLDPNGEWGDK